MKYFRYISVVVLILLIAFFFVGNRNSLYAEPITISTAIIVTACVLIVAGFVFYNWEDCKNAAINFYNNFPEWARDEIDQIAQDIAVTGITIQSINKTLVDEVTMRYGLIDDLTEWVQDYDGVDIFKWNILQANYAIDENENEWIVNSPGNGMSYNTASEFPGDYNDIEGRKNSMQFTGTYGSIKEMYSGTWSWYYEGDYLTTSRWSDFWNKTSMQIDGVTYVVNRGDTYGGNYFFQTYSNVSIACFYINAEYKPYICCSTTGGVAYKELWVPPMPVDILYGGVGADTNIDVHFGKSGAIEDSGVDVYGGDTSKNIDIPIDNPSTMVGTTSAEAVNSEWAGDESIDYPYGESGEGEGEGEGSDTIQQVEVTNTAVDSTRSLDNSLRELELPDLVISKFPFCIPFDLANAFIGLQAPPQAPVISNTIDGGMFSNIAFVVDFSVFEPIAVIIRWGLLIIFNIALIKLTRNIIRG